MKQQIPPHIVAAHQIKSLKPDGSWLRREQNLIAEEPLQICLNGEPHVTIMRTPGQDKELALGFCFTEGIIAGLSHIKLIRHCGSGAEGEAKGNEIDLILNEPPITTLPKRNLEVRSGCGICGRATIDELTRLLSPINNSIHISAGLLQQMVARMEQEQRLYTATGTTHAVALFDKDGRFITCAEDIGRHNALDKTIGYTLLHDIPRHNMVAILSGRASFEMLVKSIRAQISVVASVSGTTKLSVELAQRLGCTLIGYLRDGRLEVYTHPERIG